MNSAEGGEPSDNGAEEMSASAACLIKDEVSVTNQLHHLDEEVSAWDALPDYDIDIFIPEIKEEHTETSELDTTNLLNHAEHDYKFKEVDHIASDESSRKEMQRKMIHLFSYKRFPCKACHKIFSDNSSVKAHQRIHKGLEVFTCEECSKVFANRCSLTRHVNEHLDEDLPDRDDEKPTLFSKKRIKSDSKVTDGDQKVFQCDECEKFFNNRADMIHHLRNHNPFVCKVCGKKFLNGRNFESHERIHAGLKPYHCRVCGKAFNEKGNLNRHIKGHATFKRSCPELKLFSCEKCGKIFVTKDRLTQHAAVHSDEKPFSCDVCGAGFGRKSGILSHMAVHAFRCHECGTGSRCKKCALNHMEVRARAKPFRCHRCGKRFPRNSSLKKHQLVHTIQQFPCDQCGKVYRRKSDMVVHKQVHTRQKPFACEDCEKKFYYKTCLTKHKKIHKK